MSNDIHMVDLLHMESRIEQLLPKKDLKKDGIHSGISLSVCVCVCVCVCVWLLIICLTFCCSILTYDFLREEGRAIQDEMNQISDIERQAVGM
jgi:hypothetical protein